MREQMSLMSVIYGRATKVIGWLGLPNDDSAFAFDVLRLYSTFGPEDQSMPNQIKRHSLTMEMANKGYFTDYESLTRFFGPFGRPARALESLLERDWFHRLWVVQEAALACHLVLRCGSDELTGDEFFTAVKIRGFEYLADPPMPFLQAPYRNAYYIGLVREAVCSGIDLPLAHLAHTFSRWNCTEAVEYLNSLFGLAYRHNRNDAIIAPSPASSPATFFKDFAVQSILTSSDLGILHFAGFSEVLIDGDEIKIRLQDLTGDMPSWAADWRLKSRPVHSLRLTGDLRPYNCTTSKAHFRFIGDEHHPNSPALLEVSAVKIDSIEHLCPVYLPSFGEYGSPSFAQWVSLWYTEVQKHLPCHGVDEAFSSNLIMAGRMSLIEQPDLTISPDQAVSCFERLKTRHFKNFTEPSGDDIEAAFEDALGFVAYAEEVCRYRSLFITQKGRLGLGSAHVPIGSSIYAIHGLKTPFVVDERSENNILRGECYLDGVMDLGLSISPEDVQLTLA